MTDQRPPNPGRPDFTAGEIERTSRILLAALVVLAVVFAALVIASTRLDERRPYPLPPMPTDPPVVTITEWVDPPAPDVLHALSTREKTCGPRPTYLHQTSAVRSRESVPR